MTEKQPEIESESALPTEQVGTEPPRLDRPAVNPRQKLRAVSSPPESLAFEPYKFSRIEISPELRKAVSYGQLWRLELEDVRQALQPNRAFTPAARAASQANLGESGAGTPPKPPVSPPNGVPEGAPAPVIAMAKTWPGVVIACLLGAVPIIALVLVRWLGTGPEDAATLPAEVIETAAASPRTIDVSAPASLLPKPTTAEAEVEPEVVDPLLEPRVAPAQVAQVARAAQVARKSTTAPTNPTPAPVRSSWFHR